jgi:hypothetical protein
MFLADRLPEPANVAAPGKPRRVVELEVFIDRASFPASLRFEPLGRIERAAVLEVMALPGLAGNGKRPALEVVTAAVEVCQRYGWEPFESFIDEAKDLHVKLRKEVDGE